MSRCKGSAATRWAEAIKQMADNGVADGGRHRMISGDIIWCITCGAYADLKVSGLKEECTGKHTGPWKGGGKRGQLNDLKKNRHPKPPHRQLPPPIAESAMTLDLAAAATDSDLAEAKQRTTRYTAKDKATARSNAADPAGTLTKEKREWIESKRLEAIQRARRPKTHIDLPTDASGQTGIRQMTSAENKAAIYAKIRSGFANKRLPSDDDGLHPLSRQPRGGLNGSAQRDAEEHRTQEPGTAEGSVTDPAAVPGRGEHTEEAAAVGDEAGGLSRDLLSPTQQQAGRLSLDHASPTQ